MNVLNMTTSFIGIAISILFAIGVSFAFQFGNDIKSEKNG